MSEQKPNKFNSYFTFSDDAYYNMHTRSFQSINAKFRIQKK